MRDLNFFEPYTQPHKESKKSNIVLYTLIGVIALYILGTTIWYFAYKITLHNDIDDLKADINNKALQGQYSKAENTIKQYDLLSKYNDGVTTTYNNILSKQVVSSDLIKTIFSTLPQDVSINSISISDNTAQIQCIASNRVSVAEFQRNLFRLDTINNVEINGVSEDSTKSKYNFSAKCTLKGVDKK